MIAKSDTTAKKNTEDAQEKKRLKKIFSDNLKYYMGLRNLSVQELADAVQSPYNTVIEWKNHKNYPQIEKISKMAKLFEISMSDLIEDKEAISSPEDECVKIAKHIQQRPDLKELFNVSKRMTPQEVEYFVKMVRLFPTQKESK